MYNNNEINELKLTKKMEPLRDILESLDEGHAYAGAAINELTTAVYNLQDEVAELRKENTRLACINGEHSAEIACNWICIQDQLQELDYAVSRNRQALIVSWSTRIRRMLRRASAATRTMVSLRGRISR